MLQKAELSCEADSENYLGGSSETMYYIGLDVHKRTISYCVKDAAGRVHQEGKVGSTRRELGCLGQDSSPTPDDRHGSNDLHRMDLRPPASAC